MTATQPQLTEAQKALIQGKNFGYLATIQDDGTPQVTPVWLDLEGDLVVFNTEKRRRKTKNLHRDGRVSLVVTDAADPYRYVEIRARVEAITEEGAFEHIDRLAKKYMGLDKYTMHQPGDVRVIVKLAPTAIFGMRV